jgi:hypothetical protein
VMVHIDDSTRRHSRIEETSTTHSTRPSEERSSV